MESEAITTDHSSELCLECGLCCTGVLYSCVRLKGKEIEAALGNGITIKQHEKYGNVIIQPCPLLVNARCSIYESRMAVCREYQCELLKGLKNNSLGLDDAIKIVRKIKALVEALLADLGYDGPPIRIWELISKRLLEREANGSGLTGPDARFFLHLRSLSLACYKYLDPEIHKEFNAKITPLGAKRRERPRCEDPSSR